MIYMLGYAVIWVWVQLESFAVAIGYGIRPFDMLADRRRWFWQPRFPCARSPQAQRLAERLTRALDRDG